MNSREEIMQVLEAFNLTHSFCDAAELAGVRITQSPAGLPRAAPGLLSAPGEPVRRDRMIDPFLPNIEELVERSQSDWQSRRLLTLETRMEHGNSKWWAA